MEFAWRAFLDQWSREAFRDGGAGRRLPAQVVAAGGLGFPRATDGQIEALEARLGRALPPSYRSFLRASNGWHHFSPGARSPHRLLPAERVDWFAAGYQAWIDAYVLGDRGPRVSDAEYFVYGPGQASYNIRPEYLRSAVAISERVDASIYLLNPQVVIDNGGWECWFFANWLPGAVRYRSFQEMMQEEYRDFLRPLDGEPAAMLERPPKLRLLGEGR